MTVHRYMIPLLRYHQYITSAGSKPDKHCASHLSIRIFRIFLSLPDERRRCHFEALGGLADVSVLLVGMEGMNPASCEGQSFSHLEATTAFLEKRAHGEFMGK